MGVIGQFALHGVDCLGHTVEDEVHIHFFELLFEEIDPLGIFP